MIEFPIGGPKPLYYRTFGQYLLNILKYRNDVTYGEKTTGSYYNVSINNKKVLFDFSDHYDIQEKFLGQPYFKFHYNREAHQDYKNVFSFSPVSFYDWKSWKRLKLLIQYTCQSDTIIHIQRPYGNALERRSEVKRILRKAYKDSLQETIIGQEDYWMLINNCLTHVFVPGAREDILDRGQFQYMSFGCCTISPKLNDVLPYFNDLIPGEHYIECKKDFSDLEDKIAWCKMNRSKCVAIGNQAKELFNITSTPKKLWDWIYECLK